MEHDLVVEGKVVSAEGIQEAEVGVTEGKISEVRKQGLKGGRRIRAGRCLVFPGFIDIHVHLREPGWDYKEDFRTGTEAAVHGGVTTVADMPNNPVPVTSMGALYEKSLLAKRKGIVDIQLYGGVDPVHLSQVGEIANRVAGFKVYLSETTGSRAFPKKELRRAFETVLPTGKPLSVHCEDQSIIAQRTEKLTGVNRPDSYGDMRPPEAEIESVKEVIATMKGLNDLRVTVCHASTSETLSIVEESQSLGLRATCEAALHHLYFNRRAMFESPLLRTNPPLRTEENRAALVEGIKAGRVAFLVTDHAPHTEEEKLSEGLGGVPGLDDFGHIVSWLIGHEGVDPSAIARVACENPSKYLGLSDRGSVAAGMKADLTVLDLRSAERVRGEALRSKCGWSPYEGREFPGRVRWTIKQGEVLLDDYEFRS